MNHILITYVNAMYIPLSISNSTPMAVNSKEYTSVYGSDISILNLEEH